MLVSGILECGADSGASVVIIMLANLACPSLKYLPQSILRSAFDAWWRHRMNENIRNAGIEYTSCDAVFAEH
jgi:hypothetical protein